MIQKLNPFVLAILLLIHCGSFPVGEKRFNELVTNKVKMRASNDFDCPVGDVKVNVIDNKNFGASGCKQRATYTVYPADCSPTSTHEAGIENYCQLIRN
ncbi:hypothetical protein EHQ45_02910 [Leptospira bourretii]|nr:hypothetical protein EHQ45_02910 [Leptospira bourretii]